MRTLKNLFFAALVLSGTSVSLYSQTIYQGAYTLPDSGQTQEITLLDGSVLRGVILQIFEQEIEFKSTFGVMRIQKTQIRNLETVYLSKTKKGDWWFENPNRTRLYFMPTGRMLRKGDGYFSDYYLFFPGFATGITDNFTLGGGMSLFPTSVDEQVFYLTPKVGIIQRKHTNIAVGTLLIKLPFFEDDNDEENPNEDESPNFVGVLYGVSTFGTPDNSLTIGLGYGFVDSDLADRPMVTIGYEKRLSERTSFISENWILPGVDQPAISYGLRFMGNKIAVDLSLINTIGEDAIFPGFPFVGFVYNF